PFCTNLSAATMRRATDSTSANAQSATQSFKTLGVVLTCTSWRLAASRSSPSYPTPKHATTVPCRRENMSAGQPCRDMVTPPAKRPLLFSRKRARSGSVQRGCKSYRCPSRCSRPRGNGPISKSFVVFIQRSICMDVGFLETWQPLGKVLVQPRLECLGSLRVGETGFCQLFGDIGFAHDLGQGGFQGVASRIRRFGRDKDAVPVRHLQRGHACLFGGGNIRKQGGARSVVDDQPFDAAFLDVRLKNGHIGIDEVDVARDERDEGGGGTAIGDMGQGNVGRLAQ